MNDGSPVPQQISSTFFCFFGWKSFKKQIVQAHHEELRILEIVGWTIHWCRIVSNCIVYTSFSCSAMGFVKRCLWWYTLGLGTWKQKHRKPLVEPPQFAPLQTSQLKCVAHALQPHQYPALIHKARGCLSRPFLGPKKNPRRTCFSSRRFACFLVVGWVGWREGRERP